MSVSFAVCVQGQSVSLPLPEYQKTFAWILIVVCVADYGCIPRLAANQAANQKDAGKAASSAAKSKEARGKGGSGGDKEAGMRGAPAENGSAATIEISAAADVFKERSKAQRRQRVALLSRKELPVL